MIFQNASDDESISEGIWVEKVDKGYKIDNIPFYVKSVALDDVFSGKEINGVLYSGDFIEESGNSTIHLLFSSKEDVASTRDYLKETFNCESELSNLPELISINVPLDIEYAKVRAYLDSGEKTGDWEYQEACLSTTHSESINIL